MRGYGDSEKPVGLENYKIPVLVEDIKDIIESLGAYIFFKIYPVFRVRIKTFVLTQTKLVYSVNVFYPHLPYAIRKDVQYNHVQM